MLTDTSRYIYIYASPPSKTYLFCILTSIYSVFGIFCSLKNDLFLEVIFRMWTFEVDDVGDDICRYDVIFCWYLQCFWTFYCDLSRSSRCSHPKNGNGAVVTYKFSGLHWFLQWFCCFWLYVRFWNFVSF